MRTPNSANSPSERRYAERSARRHAERSARRYAIGVTCITLAGLVVRILSLDHQPLWRDEAFTGVVVQRSVAAMLDAVRHDSAPPLAYILTHAAIGLINTVTGLRLMSALAGAAAVPLIAALSRRAGGDRAGIAGAAVAAIAPTLVLSARDARMYALATTLVLTATLLLWRAVERPGSVRWVLYGVAVIAAVYTDYFAILAVVAQIAAVVLVLRPPFVTQLAAVTTAAGGGVTLIPWLLSARTQFAHTGVPFWVEPVGFKTVGGVLAQYLSGPPVEPGVPYKPSLQILQGLAGTAGLVAVGLVVVAAAVDRRRRRQRRDNRYAVATVFLTVCGLGGILLLAVISLWRPLLEARYASVMWGPIYALVGVGVALVPVRVAIGLLVAMGLPSLALSVIITRPNTPAVVRFIEPRLGPKDVIAAAPTAFLPLLYYGDAAVRVHLRVLADTVPWFWGTAAYPDRAVIARIPDDVVQDHGRIFYVDDPGRSPRGAPAGYTITEVSCDVQVCATLLALSHVF